MKKIFLIFLLFFSFIGFSFAGNIDFSKWREAVTDIKKVSINSEANTGDIGQNIDTLGKKILTTIKFLLGWLLVIYMVYIGIMMILSMWDDEEKLSSAKKQLWFAIIWLLFINIPGTIYNSFTENKTQFWNVTENVSIGSFTDSAENFEWNIFISTRAFWYTLEDNIIGFLRVIILFIAIFIIIYEWVKMIASAGNDEVITKSKQKIFYSLLWLVFIGVMEAWKQFAFSGDIGQWQSIFQSLANLALYFAGPVAIFFLSLAWYYFITAAGDEEKIKKAKTIVINTVFATLILLGMYTFLIDLAGFSLGGTSPNP